MSISFDAQKQLLSEAFQKEITLGTIRSFRGRLLELMEAYKRDPLPAVAIFREVLEEADKMGFPEDLRERLSSSAASDVDFSARIHSFALNVLRMKKMKELLRLGIRASESVDAKERLKGLVLSTEEFFMQEDRVPKEILTTLELIPKERCDRDNVLRAISLFQGIRSANQRQVIFQAVKEMPEDQRIDIIATTSVFLKEIPDGYERGSVLFVIGEIPSEQRSFSLIKSTLSLFQGVTNGYYRADILRVIKEIPIEQRAVIIETSTPFLKDVEDGYLRADVLRGAKEIPPEERTDTVIAIILSLFQERTNRSVCIEVINALKLLSPETRRRALGLLCCDPTVFQGDILLNIFKRCPLFIEASHNYLLQELEASIPYREKAESSARKILDERDRLLIHDEHLLFQKALEVLSITDPDLTENPKNPYRFHLQLTRTVENEVLWEGAGPGFFTGDKRLFFNFRQLRRSRREYAVEDLPEGSDPNGFRRLFNELRDRVKTSPALEREIEASYGKSLSELATNITDGPFVQRSLQIPANAREPIGNTTFYLYTILQFLSGQSREPPKNDSLSVRESALLALSEALRNCSTGQLDGVAGYYNALPLEFRAKSTAETVTKEKLSEFLQAFIRTTVMTILTEGELLYSLTAQRNLLNESHQTLYLKNRLCKQLGLFHQIQFDAHTPYLDDRIIRASLDELMQAVLALCSPENLVDKLSEEINRLLKDPKSGLTVPLDEFFDGSVGEKEGKLLYDEESDTVMISKEGSLFLLERFEYLEDRSKA